jgi:membrane associated rhomboid family serine protease
VYEAWSGLEDDGDTDSVQLDYEHGIESTSRTKKLKKHIKNLYLHDSASSDADSLEIYIVHQRYAYFSILFAVVQTGVLLVMIIQCGVAPLYLNPMIGPYPDALSYWGGKNAVDILELGEWWRLITPIFLHAGVIHLIGNIAVQLDTGAFFEREWGSRIWLAIYLSSAVGSSILSCIFMPNSISVGSSGAVMGLFGGKLAEVVCRFTEPCMTKQERIGHKVRQEQLGVVLCSVAIVMLFSFIPFGKWYLF